MPSLLFLRDGTRIFRHHLTGPVRIGRGEDCDIALVGESISRTHCEIIGDEASWRVRDLNSRHGTLLNGDAVKEALLKEGDRIEVGELTAVYENTRPLPPTTHACGMRPFEKLHAVDDGVQATRSILCAVEGPDEGKTWALKWGRCTIGGPGSRIVLSDHAVSTEHCAISCSHGRASLRPGCGPAVFAGEHLVMATPILDGEEFSLGATRLRLERHEQTLRSSTPRFGSMTSCSPRMQAVFGELAIVSGHSVPVLLQGESGTGKELAARGIHQHSGRSGAFVAVNCGGASSLWESQLFGHEKGAFTGADARRDGFFQQADHGTLFLDEIGDLPMDAQVKLLRVLGEGEVRRVGGLTIERPDVRVIAATSRDLMAMVQQGQFRSDLFFRLTGFLITLPPLRERPEDIEYLARHLLASLNPDVRLTPSALAVMRAHPWPGNVRELRQVLTRALHSSSQITARDLTFYDFHHRPDACVRAPAARYDTRREQFSLTFLESLMERHGDNRAAAARALGITPNALKYRLKKAGLLEDAPR